jgi:hypothetical protein
MNYLRLLKHERGLIISALVAGGAATGLGAPIDFVLFGLMLAGIALFHHHTLQVALTGVAAIMLYELASGGLDTGPGLEGLALHLAHEWVTLANLLGLFGMTSSTRAYSPLPTALTWLIPRGRSGWPKAIGLSPVKAAFLKA